MKLAHPASTLTPTPTPTPTLTQTGLPKLTIENSYFKIYLQLINTKNENKYISDLFNMTHAYNISNIEFKNIKNIKELINNIKTLKFKLAYKSTVMTHICIILFDKLYNLDVNYFKKILSQSKFPISKMLNLKSVLENDLLYINSFTPLQIYFNDDLEPEPIPELETVPEPEPIPEPVPVPVPEPVNNPVNNPGQCLPNDLEPDLNPNIINNLEPSLTNNPEPSLPNDLDLELANNSEPELSDYSVLDPNLNQNPNQFELIHKNEIIGRILLLVRYFGIDTLKSFCIPILEHNIVQNKSLNKIYRYYVYIITRIKAYLKKYLDVCETYINTYNKNMVYVLLLGG